MNYGGISQVEFIAILFDDCGYSTAQRRGWIFSRFGAKYADELSVAQRSEVITLLKKEKANDTGPDTDGA